VYHSKKADNAIEANVSAMYGTLSVSTLLTVTVA
jgi:hypothetical protein